MDIFYELIWRVENDKRNIKAKYKIDYIGKDLRGVGNQSKRFFERFLILDKKNFSSCQNPKSLKKQYYFTQIINSSISFIDNPVDSLIMVLSTPLSNNFLAIFVICLFAGVFSGNTLSIILSIVSIRFFLPCGVL